MHTFHGLFGVQALMGVTFHCRWRAGTCSDLTITPDEYGTAAARGMPDPFVE